MNARASVCARCGRVLPADAPGGLCPACLVAGCFEELPPEAPTAGRPGVLFQFGDYEVFKELGRGGMGVVYLARQISLNRTVALKCIRASALVRAENLRRFQTEARAAARLQHPRIVAIHEVGEHAGEHWLSMDYVAGTSLAATVHEAPLPPRRAAAWIAQIAVAIHHAHERGVLHRDLKPSNILIDEAGEPHVTDFGLAKLLDADSEVTHSGTVLGSPHYMAPEQAEGRMDQLDARTDVYALGATLYECLTGRPPFAAATPVETLRMVLDQEPVPPRALNASIPRDLETICLKCLAKPPAARYASARDLADDLERFGRDEPVQARPTSPVEKAWRWCRRKPALASALAAVVVVALVGGVLTLRQWRRAEQNAVAERQQRELAQKRLFAADTQLAYQNWRNENFPGARSYLAAHAGESNLHDFAWRYLWNRCQGDHRTVLRGHASPVGQMVFAPDGRGLATRDYGGQLRVWDLDGQTQRWSAEGVLALGGFVHDGRAVLASTEPHSVTFLDAADGRPQRTLPAEGVLFDGLVNGSTFALTSTNVLLALADLASGQLQTVLPGRRTWRFPVERLRPQVQATSDGARLAWLDFQKSEHVGMAVLQPDAQPTLWPVPTALCLALTVDGSTWAVGCSDGRVQVGPWGRGPSLSWPAHATPVMALAFAPDGAELVTGHDSYLLRRWDARTGLLIGNLWGQEEGTSAIAFAPDGGQVATGSADGTVRLWWRRQIPPEQSIQGLATGWQNLSDQVALSPDGRLLAVAATNGTVRVLTTVSLRETTVLPEAGVPVGFLERGRQLLTLGGGRLQFWSVGSSPGLAAMPAGDAPGGARLLPSRDKVPVATARQEPRPTGAGRFTESAVLIRQVPCPADPPSVRLALLSPDERSVALVGEAAAGHGDVVCLAAVQDGRVQLQWRLEAGWLKRAAFWDEGREFAAVDDAGIVRRWSTADGRLVRTLSAHVPLPNARAFVAPLALSPDGSRFVTGGMDGSVKLWDARTHQPRTALAAHRTVVTDAAFSPDGRLLATADREEAIRLWNLELAREVGSLEMELAPPTSTNAGIKRLLFTPRGDALVGLNRKGRLTIWRTERTTAAAEPGTARSTGR